MPGKDKISSICFYCRQPILHSQRPSVRLDHQREAHMECYIQANNEKKPN